MHRLSVLKYSEVYEYQTEKAASSQNPSFLKDLLFFNWPGNNVHLRSPNPVWIRLELLVKKSHLVSSSVPYPTIFLPLRSAIRSCS